MSTTSKRAYTYKLNLIAANIFSIVIFVLIMAFTFMIVGEISFVGDNFALFMVIMFLYLILHEILHGIGYIIGGTKIKNTKYGICLEKGFLYAMVMQEINKKNILISLQMPFMVIGVITYVIGIIFHLDLLVVLSIVNLMGASMDLMMFLYILKLPKDVTYSESGKNDEFVLISKEDLSKKKSMFFKVVSVKEYKKEDYVFKNFKRFEISKFSIVFFLILLLDYIVMTLL
ncbi:MAG: DUF3267 domain-containing protein [Firmicutes bacterium]|nr:DUF3267 domain-containing protein [Bacillota bacterium]